jgi:hypothetical protein
MEMRYLINGSVVVERRRSLASIQEVIKIVGNLSG